MGLGISSILDLRLSRFGISDFGLIRMMIPHFLNFIRYNKRRITNWTRQR